ncbi:MAG: hypothetical protein ACO3NK_03665 [Prochlorotrichaceae cyanobacterium]|jgi:hypothetical protein
MVNGFVLIFYSFLDWRWLVFNPAFNQFAYDEFWALLGYNWSKSNG